MRVVSFFGFITFLFLIWLNSSKFIVYLLSQNENILYQYLFSEKISFTLWVRNLIFCGINIELVVSCGVDTDIANCSVYKMERMSDANNKEEHTRLRYSCPKQFQTSFTVV